MLNLKKTTTNNLFLFPVIFIFSCSQIGPANFWLTYHKESIVKKFNDQGPWGGVLSIYWKNEEFDEGALTAVDFCDRRSTHRSQRLNQITRQQIQSFHTDFKGQGLSASTCNHYIKLIKHSLNLAIDWDMLETNPAVRITQYKH